MQKQKETHRIHVVLQPGEEIVEALSTLAIEENIPSASFTGIGAIENPTLGYFDVEKKEYLKTTYPGDWELISLMGSISWDGDDPVVHAHVCISDRDGATRAGHLFNAKVSITGEIFLHLNETRLERSTHNPFGLKLLEL